MKNKKSGLSLFTKVCFLFMLILIGWFVFLFFQNAYFIGNNKQIEKNIKEKKDIIKKHTGENGDIQTQNLDEFIKKIEKNRVRWSEQTKEILSYETNDIRFKKFLITPDGDVSITGISRNIKTITQVLEIIKNNKKIINPFINNISKSTEIGDNSLQFQLSFSLL